MMIRNVLVALFVAGTVTGTGCGRTELGGGREAAASEPGAPSAKSAASKATDAKAEPGAEFHAKLLEIAASYEKLGRYDERLRVSPLLCDAPRVDRSPRGEPLPARDRMSQSGDAKTHGRKVYRLFVKNQAAYGVAGEQKVGQVIVKEGWTPKLAEGGPSPKTAYNPDDKKYYAAGEKAALFIMVKLDPKTPSTDEGWVYGTVSADGKQVTSAGRVESCMKCHQGKRTADRMFGLQYYEPGDEK